MDRVIDELGMWLALRGLPVEGIELKIVMPTAEDASRAVAWMKRDLEPHLVADSAERPGGDAKIHGVEVTFEPRRD